MTQNKELEIQLQFLDEAQEYLGALETALLGLASSGVDIDRINAALRAAHSIKGGAGMMGFQALSAMAHRLEDSFKVLKIQRHTIEVDGDLEGLLLTGVDCLRQVIECDRTTLSALSSTTQSPGYQGVNSHWLDHHANPIFEQLHDRLGDPEAEDANSILSPEEGQDVIPMLFQTEVEGCLGRLESVMAEHSPCLREEVDILAQELGGLGEMLQLTAFTELCGSVSQQITAASTDRLEEVAALALQMWRRSQALVLTGNLEALPRSLDIAPDTTLDTAPDMLDLISEDSETDGEIAASWSDLDLFEGLTSSGDWTGAEDWTGTEDWNNTESWTGTEDWANSTVLETENLGTVASETVTPEMHDPDLLEEPVSTSIDSPTAPESAETITVRSVRTSSKTTQKNTEFQVPEVTLDPSTIKDSPENSVRVPSKQLDQLSDLFGELTIERNGLDLHLKRLRTLVQMLTQRVQTLDRSNAQLRNSYDRVSMQSSFGQSNLGQPNLGLPVLNFGTTPQTRLLIGSDESRLDESRLDESYSTNLGGFDTLEMDQYNEQHLMSQEVMETIVQIQEVSSDIEISLEDTEQTSRELRKTSRQLRTKLTQVRMRPLTDITDRFPRAIRELSLQHGKPVQIQIYGANTLVDRNILEALSDPLMHLLRNAFDHGIEDTQTRSDRGKPEQGLIEIRALHRNNRTIITLRDDGGGIPLDKVRAKARQMGLDEVLLTAATDEELLSLIFEPGFSTSEQVTALSGRGVGMDVVRDRLRQIQGEIKVDTQPGLGTTFTLSVPFTLSVARVLIAESHGMLMAFPIDAIEEMLLLSPEQIIATAGNEAFTWEDTMVQLIRLSQWLEFRRAYQPEGLETQASINVPTVLLLTQGSQLVGLQIDRNWGEQEVAIRKVEGGLPMPAGFSNCTILGDGRVVPLVNIPDLLHWIASCERSQVDALLRSPSSSPSALLAALMPSESYGDRQPTVLVIDDSINVRRLLALTLEKAGYQVAQAKDGQDALDKLSAGLQVQVVICDIEMPRLDGYGFLAKVKASPPLERIPIAMLTSRSGEKHRQLAMSLGASAYFSKPYNEQALLQTLESLVELEAAI